MTSGREPSSLRLSLTSQDTGVVIGSLAWVMGALEIMKDRGHAEGDEEFHDLYDALTPMLNRVVALISGGRSALSEDQAMQEQIEAAYGQVRAAFETWIELTAADTAQVALGQRLAHSLDSEDDEASLTP